ELVLSVSAGKDLDPILGALLPLADRVTVTRAEPVRSLAPDDLAAAVRAAAPRLPQRGGPDPHAAPRGARRAAPRDPPVLATGSVYLAGLARRAWRTRRPAAHLTPAAPSA